MSPDHKKSAVLDTLEHLNRPSMYSQPSQQIARQTMLVKGTRKVLPRVVLVQKGQRGDCGKVGHRQKKLVFMLGLQDE